MSQKYELFCCSAATSIQFFITVILRVSSLLCIVCIHNMNTVWKPAETQLALWLERLAPDPEDMRWNLQRGPTRRTN